MTKKAWKIYYRMLRIARREALKAQMDLIVYGSGMVYVPDKGDPYHVPIHDAISIDLSGGTNG